MVYANIALAAAVAGFEGHRRDWDRIQARGYFRSACGHEDRKRSSMLRLRLISQSVALLLGRETGALLIGERTNRARIRKVREIIAADPVVERIGEMLTMQLGPQQALLTVRIKFRRSLSLQQLESAIEQIKNQIREKEPTMAQIFIEADSIPKSPSDKSEAA